MPIAAKRLVETTHRFHKATMRASAWMKDTGLRPPEMFFLGRIPTPDAGEGIQPGVLAKMLGVSPGHITQMLNNLESRGLVERIRPVGDRRRLFVRMTTKGSDILTAAQAAIESAMDGLVRHLGDDDSTRLVELLERAITYLETSTSKENTPS